MNEQDNLFSIPEGLVEKIYEISGDSERYKGLIMVVANESGEPVIYTKFDSVIMELGLQQALEDYLIKSKSDQGVDK
jgi:CO dehydrogenase/acetyl-CoA synthase gamma subunit (corrinoid Fe-S protein)|tara:strand:+ start:2594 stop:2824 length:231 start_codon:yes stop_codon:yes gene_type:complete